MRECQMLLSDLPVPAPFSVEALVRNMEGVRGRQILLEPLEDSDGGLGTACGLRVKTSELTIILYRRRPSRNQTEHVICHELAHEWLDHGTCLTPDQIHHHVPKRIREEILSRFPSALIQGRAVFDTPDEKVAEISATLMRCMPRRSSSGMGNDLISLLESSLAHPVAPPRRRS
ncbi:hypothetical protein EF906_02595 [Streptomyces sp. WAC08241]|nr:hypothetical protein EF906_02595 [Streptomyces sp. WAC08241]